jgi:hypothetical protein
MNPFGSLLICVAGWMNRHLQEVIAYLQKEIRVLREQLDKKSLHSSKLQRQQRTPKRTPNELNRVG